MCAMPVLQTSAGTPHGGQSAAVAAVLQLRRIPIGLIVEVGVVLIGCVSRSLRCGI